MNGASQVHAPAEPDPFVTPATAVTTRVSSKRLGQHAQLPDHILALSSGEAATGSKRTRRRISVDLASLVRPSFQAIPVDSAIEWHLPVFAQDMGPDGMWCTPPCVGPDGCFWFASYERPHRHRFQISALTAEGMHELVAQGLEARPTCLVSPCAGQVIFNSEGTICSAKRGLGVSQVCVANARFIAACDGGLLVLRDGPEQRTLERRDISGSLTETLDFPFKLPRVFTCGAGGKEVIFSEKSRLMKIDLEAREVVPIAGKRDQGCRDGYGMDARFNLLAKPQYDANSHWVFVRDVLGDGTSRFCCVDLHTYKVTTIEIEGLRSKRIAAWVMYSPHANFLTEEGSFYRADMGHDASASTFSDDMAAVEWSELSTVEFLLPRGASTRSNRQVLAARSAYFAALLSPEHGMKESSGGVVDLTTSPLDPDAFRAVLTYLATDELSLMAGESHFAITDSEMLKRALFCVEVAGLADQYQLLRLVRLAEAFVLRVALPGRDGLVLPLLERTFELGGAVENACWQAVDERAADVLAAVGEAEVAQILDRAPALRLRLLFRVALNREALVRSSTAVTQGPAQAL